MNASRIQSRLKSPTLSGNLAVGGLLLGLALCAGFWQSEAFGFPDPGLNRWLAAFTALAVYLVACVMLSLARSKHSQAMAATRAAFKAENSIDRVLVSYASQSGYTGQLAEKTMASLRAGGCSVELIPLSDLRAEQLQQAQRALFLISTTGEGDAPDMAAGFVDSVMRSELSLEHLQYGLLALGDSEYVNYCGFGRAVDEWLERAGAQRLFDTIEVDDGDDGALRHWQYRLGQLSGCSDLPDWQEPRYSRWRLLERRVVNPGSAGDPCFRLALEALDPGKLSWRAGDVIEVGPQNAAADVEAWLSRHQLDGDCMVKVRGKPWTLRKIVARSALDLDATGMDVQQIADALVRLPHRDYSIASIPAEGKLELLLRQWRRTDGSLGLGTGWLTEYASPGAEVLARVRTNEAFHAPNDDSPVLLIGNGTGIASLRALLKQRISRKRYRNWLIFGERNSQCDFHYGEEIRGWKKSGAIERLDLAFSRDQSERIYVQDRLEAEADAVREWVDQGAIIYVCGSLQGMAPGVDEALRRILGDSRLRQLAATSRYRRDVY
ncbi:MAG TPA: sulfite reductase flavoprotein subunit alpha [Dokdonella sp.]|uniref:sulfite reductase flavoprotein subunit alpha n=1 Tax=Dokdonella sp. TaxID=2291710 RepID=UPI002D7F6A24|nr:sulfite reductase flavoprotein subunit alpha [Dokdonella sp.]HET9033088.1 sulfite reductase flavoprotein subunit alpha [Dokdonella sp.]